MYSFLFQDLKDEEILNYYNNKKKIVVKRLQYDVVFPTTGSYDPKVKRDSIRSQKEMYENIYNEVRKTKMSLENICLGNKFNLL